MTWSKAIGACVSAGALTALCGSSGIAAGAEPSDPGAGCPVMASAQGVQLMVSKSDDLALQAPIGAAVPAAQACLNYALDESRAFAANPYPGATVLTAPALVRGMTDAPVPDYPWYASSEYPASTHGKYQNEGFALRANSTRTSSDADSRSARSTGGGAAGSTLATASAKVDPAVGGAAAKAASDTAPLEIKDVLRLGQMHSTATARLTEGGKVQRGSQLRIGRTTVAGQEVVITPDGLRAADQNVGLPDEEPAKALEQAGITVRYVTAEQTANSVLSAGLEIRVRNEDPQTGGVTNVQYVVGRTFAAVAAVEGAEQVPQAPGGTPSSPDSGSSGAAAAGGSAPSPAEAPPGAGQVPASAPAPSSAPPPAVAAPVQLAGKPLDIGLSAAYLVIVLAALVMFASGTLLRLLGVKTRWTS